MCGMATTTTRKLRICGAGNPNKAMQPGGVRVVRALRVVAAGRRNGGPPAGAASATYLAPGSGSE